MSKHFPKRDKFKPWTFAPAKRAQVDFPNGYSLSIIHGKDCFGVFSSKAMPYECAILHNRRVCYDSGIPHPASGETINDVFSYCTKAHVCQLLDAVAAL